MPGCRKRDSGLNASLTSRPLIVGAGIAGLTLSLALARLGLRSRVLEARPSATTDGAGIQLGPNATSILGELGVLDAVTKHAGKPRSIVVRKIADGQIISTLPLPTPDQSGDQAPYLVVHRSALHDALLAAATASDEIELRFGFDCREISLGETGVKVRSGEGETETGQLVVGCDGVWSRTREVIAPEFQLPYSGMIAARTIVPVDQAPMSLRDENTGVWLGPDAHIVKYPIDAGQSIALIAVSRHPQRLQGWGRDVDRQAVLQRLPSHEPALAALLGAAPVWRQWALYDPSPLSKWWSGRAAVIGDAAHPILPFLAQGGAMAVEDAFCLATLLQEHGGPAAFPVFDRQRRDRINAVQSASRKNGQIYHLSGVSAAARDVTMRLFSARQLMRRYDWIYKWRHSCSDKTS
ncbi:MAG: FAD-dependent monooxygenase [Pseudomonadota bacterium]